MEDIKLLKVFNPGQPDNGFMVCDVDDDRTFMDPLTLFLQPFYDPGEVNEEGLYAIGGEINVKYLVKAYSYGIFPWFPYKYSDKIYWYCPKERYVIFPEKIHVGHSLRNLMNKHLYQVTTNQAFERVIHNCRCVEQRDQHVAAWLSEEIEDCFIELHRLGYAKSVEVWEGEELVGGFYGFLHKGVLEGESMFSLRPSASQVGLVELCRNPYIDGEKIKLIDTQFETQTFRRLGGEYISYTIYRRIMEDYG